MAWVNAYLKAVTHVKFTGGLPAVPPAADGPVPVMLATEYTMGRSGALDTDLLAQRDFYGTNFTNPLLFMGDGAYFSGKAAAMNLTGEQWGVMNETGSYPGQPWLWLYTLWYYVPGFSASANVDLIAVYLTGLGTILLLAIPFIPGLRDIPRWIPVHRLIWRTWEPDPGRWEGAPAVPGPSPPARRPAPATPGRRARARPDMARRGRTARAGRAPARAGRRPGSGQTTGCGTKVLAGKGAIGRGWIVEPRNPASGGSDDGRCADAPDRRTAHRGGYRGAVVRNSQP